VAKTIHQLKILPEHFEKKLAGKKFWELRIHDRDFKIGDTLQLREYTGYNYTGRSMRTQILDLYPLNGYVIISEKITYKFLIYNDNCQPEK
jgi:hypothetical protein